MTSTFPGKQFAWKTFGAALVSSLLLFSGKVRAADRSLPITGNLLGTVLDDGGTPQIGATIQLLNKYNRVVAKTLSGPKGHFAFASLPDDVYALRASVPSFLPAIKDKILVQGGMDSMLEIHLATLFSTIEVSYALPTAAMSDDWKWVLRSSAATRPVNRMLGAPGQAGDGRPQPFFSSTHAVVFLSGGDGGFADSDNSFSDLGTGFALSTNILGDNQVRLSGAVGGSTVLGTPQMALAATYSRTNSGNLAQPPEVTLGMTQIGGIGVQQQLNGANAANGSGGTVPLRAISLSTYNATDLFDGMHLEYGATTESVEYLQSTNRVSPFGRITVDAGKAGEVVVAYSAGGQPTPLILRDRMDNDEGSDNDLSTATANPGRVPEVSLRNGRLRLQRTQNAEVGIRKTIGDTTLAASAFYEDTVNGRINVAGDVSDLSAGNLLSDSLSTTSFLSIGNFRRSGLLLSSTQHIGDNLDVSLAYGRIGGFAAAGVGNGSDGGRNLLLDANTTNVASVDVKTSIPVLATQLTAGYGWVESGSVIPRHIFTTQSTRMSPGLNIYFRQPLPTAFGLPGRLELTGSLQNLLAQGYLPFDSGDGRRLMVVQSPRAIRGGLNFIF